jgi:hypothetical protein
MFDQNDDAADWLAGFAEAPDWSMVDAAFDLNTDYLEGPESCNALAAAEVVAAAKGSPSPRLSDQVRNWAAGQAAGGEQRTERATETVQRIRDDSELSGLWEDTDEFEDWKKSVEETIARL